jgi:hypothetical protein
LKATGAAQAARRHRIHPSEVASMDLATKIKGLLKEADIYRTQGLFTEARDNYRSVIEMVRAHPQVKNREKLLDGLALKLGAVEAQIDKVESAPLNPQLSDDTQGLIKKLFGFSQAADEDNAALDGAIALTKFGQYPRALAEFEALLERESVRLVAAKNILRCHLATEDLEAATDQYGRWLEDPRFGPDMMVKIRAFLETLLDQKDVHIVLPEPTVVGPSAPSLMVEVEEPEEDDVLDISAVRFEVPHGPQKGQSIEYEVSFQSGNVISILINERDKPLVQALRLGDTIADVELTSAVAIFNGTATVMTKNQIKVGPRKGCFSIDLKIKNE